MPSLPVGIISVLQAFSPLFSKTVWVSARTLIIGAILSQGSRTVASALRVMGLSHFKRFERYHRVLNRANWSCRHAAKILLGLLIALLPENWPITVAIDDTLERRKGQRIEAKGRYRDPIRSGDKYFVSCFGLKWLCMMIIVPLPWSKRPWALPFLTILMPSKTYNDQHGYHHKTLTQWSIQAVKCVAFWLNKRKWYLLGDGHFGNASLALVCIKFNVTLISRLRFDARLFDFLEKTNKKKKVGRPSPAGKRLPTLDKIANDTKTKWKKICVGWYANKTKEVLITSQTCLWYAAKMKPFPIRWVLMKDPKHPNNIHAFFSTDLDNSPQEIIERFILRWNIEVTFQESRRHLGLETQRQWSEKAIARTTPFILGLYSLVCLMGMKLRIYSQNFVQSSAWYTKNDFATFSDVLAIVRRRIWSFRYFSRSQNRCHLVKLQKDEMNFIINQLANSG